MLRALKMINTTLMRKMKEVHLQSKVEKVKHLMGGTLKMMKIKLTLMRMVIRMMSKSQKMNMSKTLMLQ